MAGMLEQPPLTQLWAHNQVAPHRPRALAGRLGHCGLGPGQGRAAPPGSRSWPGSACSRLSCSSGFGTGTSGSCSGQRGPGCGRQAGHLQLAGSSGWKRKNGEGGVSVPQGSG